MLLQVQHGKRSVPDILASNHALKEHGADVVGAQGISLEPVELSPKLDAFFERVNAVTLRPSGVVNRHRTLEDGYHLHADIP